MTVWIVEYWYFKPDIDDITDVMQEMDDLLGPAAHDHPGWCGHARFFSRLDDANRGMMLYPWRSAQLHDDLVASEDPKLVPFYEKYCTRPREVVRYAELAVDVEDHHDGHGPAAAEPAGGSAAGSAAASAADPAAGTTP